MSRYLLIKQADFTAQHNCSCKGRKRDKKDTQSLLILFGDDIFICAENPTCYLMSHWHLKYCE